MDNFAVTFEKIGLAVKTPSAWLSALLLYLAPLKGVFWLVFIILIADFATGVAASAKKHIPRSSKRFRRSISKGFCYFGIIYLFFEFEKQVGMFDFVCGYKLIAGFIFLIEVISILENMFIITEHPIFTKLIKLIRGKASMDEKNGSLLDDVLNEKNDLNTK